MSAKFQRTRRLLSANDYRAVFKAPDFKAGQQEILLLARRNDQQQHRLGLAIAKKHVPTAVKRNLIKRLLREHFRQMSAGAPALDIVVLTRPGAGCAARVTLKSAIERQFARLVKRAADQ